MHLHRELSGTLLILSRAFAYNTMSAGQTEDEVSLAPLKDTLASLPDALLNVTELKVSSDMDYKKRLEIIKEQEELIEDEKEQEEARRFAL
jgi:LETM1 and EF-hand domain-containing protein 1